MDDMALVREYAARQSEAAFAELVSRHLGLVYSAALRQVQKPHLAEEIAQTVFIILARKAPRLPARTVLPAWLLTTTRYAALAQIRASLRRQQREQEAYMQSLLNEPDCWPEVAPLLDEAMAKLGETDRNAIVLRFFQNKTLAEVGASLGASQDAARVRVNRALEKLRKLFAKRGLTLSVALLTGAISAHSVQAAPAGLAVTVSAAASGAAAGGSTLTLVKEVLQLMAWTKAKTAGVAGLALLLAAATTTTTISRIRNPTFNPEEFRATTYPTGPAGMETNSYGHPLNYSFPITPVQRCSINGLLNQCMEISGWRYLMDKEVAPGTVNFGSPKALNGEEWVAAFEAALQTGTPEWWDKQKQGFRKENLVLIRVPKQKTVLVLPQDKAAKYRWFK